MRGSFLFFAVFAALILPSHAQTQDYLNIDLVQDHVNISSGFTGADLSVFGVKGGRGAVAIVLEGPPKSSTVRRKERVLGAWINRSWLNFDDVPTYYDFALSVPENKTSLSQQERRENHIGLNSLYRTPRKTSYDEATIKQFQEALVRTKQNHLLFPLKPREVVFLDDRFFRVDFHLPANVPIGEYTVRGYLIRGGDIRAEVVKDMRVGQIGFSSHINSVAGRHPFAYGVLCIFIALSAGLLSDLLVRRH